MTRSKQPSLFPSLLPTDEAAPGKEKAFYCLFALMFQSALTGSACSRGQRARIRCQIKASDLEEGSGDMASHHGRTETE